MPHIRLIFREKSVRSATGLAFLSCSVGYLYSLNLVYSALRLSTRALFEDTDVVYAAGEPARNEKSLLLVKGPGGHVGEFAGFEARSPRWRERILAFCETKILKNAMCVHNTLSQHTVAFYVVTFHAVTIGRRTMSSVPACSRCRMP